MHELPDPHYNPWTWCAEEAPVVTEALIRQYVTEGERAQRTLYLAGVRDERLRVDRLVQSLIQEYRSTGEPTFELGELLMQIVCGV